MRREKSAGIQFFCIGVFCGLIIYLFLFGAERLDVTNVSWIFRSYSSDVKQHHMGWVFFRNSDWQFPLGLTDGMEYPNLVSIIYTDSLPTLAIIFKIFRNFLPETFQYIGIYGLLCFIMQGGMGGLIASKYTRSKFLCLVSAIFFTITPVMLGRMYAHTELSSHYILLIALYLWICCKKITPAKACLLWGWIGFLGGSTHIYFLPMTGIILLGFCMEKYITKQYRFLECCCQIFCFCSAAFLILYIEGAFYGNTAAQMAEGYGGFSANLNTLYNGSGGAGYLAYDFPINSGQEEGYGYLGAGLIFLCAFSFGNYFYTRKKKGLRGLNKKYLFPIIFVVALAFCLAVSNHVRFNDKLLFIIELPKNIYRVLSIFRASGRFIWVVVYIIQIFAIKLILTADCNRKVIAAVMTICCALQCFDMQEFFHRNRDIDMSVQEEQSIVVKDDWKRLAENRDKIIIMGNFVVPDKQTELMELAEYAMANHMKITQFYFARTNMEEINLYIQKCQEELLRGEADKNAIYVFDEGENVTYDLSVYELDGYRIGVAQ